MAQFEVQGADASGKNVTVFIEADSPKTARQKARGQGIVPVSVTVADAARVASGAAGKSAIGAALTMSIGGGVSTQDLADMTRQLSTLVKAHVPIVESLTALVEQIDHPKLKNILATVRTQVNEGKSLGDALSGFPKVFNNVFVNMVRAGESSGKLDVVLSQIADFTENQVKLKAKVQGALMYPMIMTTIGFLVVVIIMIKVVPEITKIFVDMKRTLPLPTQVMIFISNIFRDYLWEMLAGILGSLVLIERYIKTESGRAWKDRRALTLPVVGKIVRTLSVARFARTLGTLLASGVPMLTALDITRNVVNNWVFEGCVDACRTAVSEGRSLAYSLRQTGQFPPIVVHMVNVGEKTGELENMLISVADNYEQQVNQSLSTLTGLLEPVMIVVMAGIVGMIVMAVLMPILEMNQFAN